MLRASHRQTDSSKLMHQNWPYHPHEQEDKVEPGEIVTLEIGIWATGMVFEAEETLELRLSGFYPGMANFGTNEHSLNVGQHTVHFGGDHQRYLSRPTAGL
jgi:predicted acyl esterase